MITEFGKGMLVFGLNVLKYLVYIVSAPFVVVFMLYGAYFIVAAFCWVVIVDAAFICALLIFMVNFFMFFVALFDASLWATMGNMWNWLWSWFANGNVALWPHFAKSFLPYLLSGAVLALFYEVVKRLEIQKGKVKKMPYVI